MATKDELDELVGKTTGAIIGFLSESKVPEKSIAPLLQLAETGEVRRTPRQPTRPRQPPLLREAVSRRTMGHFGPCGTSSDSPRSPSPRARASVPRTTRAGRAPLILRPELNRTARHRRRCPRPRCRTPAQNEEVLDRAEEMGNCMAYMDHDKLVTLLTAAWDMICQQKALGKKLACVRARRRGRTHARAPACPARSLSSRLISPRLPPAPPGHCGDPTRR